MPEARASWNTVYRSRDGFACQITLRDEDEETLWKRANAMLAVILDDEGLPAQRASFGGEQTPPPPEQDAPQEPAPKPEKTYLDEKGARRCNLKLKSGRRCNTAVVEREGRYGRFWSCANYKEHAA